MTDKWIIIGTDKCTWCSRAKELLDKHGIPFTWFNVSHDLTLFSFLEHSGLTTVPQIYMNGTLVGGYEKTRYLLEGDLNAEV